jgi:hypothetical protein
MRFFSVRKKVGPYPSGMKAWDGLKERRRPFQMAVGAAAAVGGEDE